jgi:hypothetical protein
MFDNINETLWEIELMSDEKLTLIASHTILVVLDCNGKKIQSWNPLTKYPGYGLFESLQYYVKQ